MLLRLAYLGITNAFALLRLLPGSDRHKNAEILALRNQLAVLQRQLERQRVRFDPHRQRVCAGRVHHRFRPAARDLPAGSQVGDLEPGSPRRA
jgi:putative transposase